MSGRDVRFQTQKAQTPNSPDLGAQGAAQEPSEGASGASTAEGASKSVTGHTPGPWRVSDGSAIVAVWADLGEEVQVASMSTTRWSFDADGGRNLRMLRERDANARLIAAAPAGLAVAKTTYAALLHLSIVERLRLQADLCALRDFIADATGRSPEDVQNEYEENAWAGARR